MRRRWIAAVVLAAASAAALVALLGGGSSAVDTPRSPIAVAGTIAPQAAHFGDPLEARAEILVDNRAVDPASITLDGMFGSYEPTARPTTTHTDSGAVTRVTVRYRLECLAQSCLPPDPVFHGRRLVVLAPIRVSYRRRDGGIGAMLVRWPPVEVSSRLSAIDMAQLTPIDQPPYHATTALPPVTYAMSPTLLVALLAAGAALLLASAGLLAVRFARRPARVGARAPEPVVQLEPVRVLSPLERALHLLERARERGAVPEQRKALENLAGELRRTGERDLALSASVLAWAERPPGSDATGALAAAVQRRIAKGVNGYPTAS